MKHHTARSTNNKQPEGYSDIKIQILCSDLYEKKVAFSNKGNNIRTKADFGTHSREKRKKQPQRRLWPARSPALLPQVPGRAQPGSRRPSRPPSSRDTARAASICPTPASCTPAALPACPWVQSGLIIPRWAAQSAQVPSTCPVSVALRWWRRLLAARSGRCRRVWLHPGAVRLRLGFLPQWAGSGTCTSSPSPETPARISALGPHCWGNLPEPPGSQGLGDRDTYLKNKAYLKNEELCLLILFWKSRMTSPARKPTCLGLVILENAITEWLCNVCCDIKQGCRLLSTAHKLYKW